MYKTHSHCRACGYAKPGAQGIKSAPTDKLIEVLDLGVQPLANDFKKDDEDHAGWAPLKVMFCPNCSLAQLSVVVDPTVLYANYSYITSGSDTMKAHFERLWEDINAERKIKRVVEIGSNTGDLMEHFSRQGAQRVVGIDPAQNLANLAIAKGVQTIISPFSFESAMKSHDRMEGDVDLVIARHVFCHCDRWDKFIFALLAIGHKETIYCIEVPYAADMLRMNSWDQIYHEHLSYLTIRSIKALLVGSGLHVHNVQRYPIHGGAILITLRRDESILPPHPEICAEIGRECVTLDDWKRLANVATKQTRELRGMIEGMIGQGKRVAALGASAKSTVWINACNLNRRHIEFIADNTPQKQLTFSPGTNIPIVDEGAIMRELPDYVVLFCWNFAGECLAKFALARLKAVKFIIPVPELAIV